MSDSHQRQILSNIDGNVLSQLHALHQHVDDKIEQVLTQKSAFSNVVHSGVTEEGARTRKMILDLHEMSMKQEDYQSIMRSLSFPTMSSREEDIHDTFKGTF